MDIDSEFGSGSAAITRKLTQHREVKLLMQINRFCAVPLENGVCKRAYALENIANALDDYANTHGLTINSDYDIAVIVHGAGGPMAVKDSVLAANKKGSNPFEAQVRELMRRGVKFYLCQNTVRHLIAEGALTKGKAIGEIIEGVAFVTAGITALVDFQNRGWSYVQP